MSRNKLYEGRIEICVLPEIKYTLECIANNKKIRVNELLRQIIDDYLRRKK